MEILIKRLSEHAVLPNYDSESSSAIDICSLEEVVVDPGQKVSVSTGVAIAVPVGYAGFLINRGCCVLGKDERVVPVVIDSSCRGEIMINFVNAGNEQKVIAAGEKIARLLIQEIERPTLIEVEELS